jgi:SPP1 family predicted phage head-tail adaptor
VAGNVSVPLRKGAGQRRTRITLQHGTAVLDALGGRTQTWTTYGHDWAAVDETLLKFDDTQASVGYVLTIPYRADVETKQLAGTQQRVVFGDRTTKVLAVMNPEQRNRDLVLQCALVTT